MLGFERLRTIFTSRSTPPGEAPKDQFDLTIGENFHRLKRTSVLYSSLFIAASVPGLHVPGVSIDSHKDLIRFLLFLVASYYYGGFVLEYLEQRRQNAGMLKNTLAKSLEEALRRASNELGTLSLQLSQIKFTDMAALRDQIHLEYSGRGIGSWGEEDIERSVSRLSLVHFNRYGEGATRDERITEARRVLSELIQEEFGPKFDGFQSRLKDELVHLSRGLHDLDEANSGLEKSIKFAQETAAAAGLRADAARDTARRMDNRIHRLRRFYLEWFEFGGASALFLVCFFLVWQINAGILGGELRDMFWPAAKSIRDSLGLR